MTKSESVAQVCVNILAKFRTDITLMRDERQDREETETEKMRDTKEREREGRERETTLFTPTYQSHVGSVPPWLQLHAHYSIT